METAIVATIRADSTLNALLVGDNVFHVYPLRLPDAFPDTQENAMTYQEITQETVYPTFKASRVQFNCYSKTYDGASDLANALIDCFDDLSSMKLNDTFYISYIKVENRAALYDDVTKLWYFAVDFTFKY